MPTSPPEILELAKHVRRTFLTEAGRRSAVSRAYYAAMHQTLQVFGAPTTQADDESSHRAVIRAAAERARAPGPARVEASVIAQSLDVLRRRRNRADYRLGSELEKAECDDCIASAEKLMELCDGAKTKLDALAAKVTASTSPTSSGPSMEPEPPSGGRPAIRRIK